jgi:aspartate ammonia-lyase
MIFSKQIPLYTSEITQFIEALKASNPQLEHDQREGRARLWDSAPIDLDARSRAIASRVDQKPYVYHNK